MIELRKIKILTIYVKIEYEIVYIRLFYFLAAVIFLVDSNYFECQYYLMDTYDCPLYNLNILPN